MPVGERRFKFRHVTDIAKDQVEELQRLPLEERRHGGVGYTQAILQIDVTPQIHTWDKSQAATQQPAV